MLAKAPDPAGGVAQSREFSTAHSAFAIIPNKMPGDLTSAVDKRAFLVGEARTSEAPPHRQ